VNGELFEPDSGLSRSLDPLARKSPSIIPWRDFIRSSGAMSQQTDGFQTSWDSTSLGTLKTCARKYQLSNLYGFRGKKEAIPLTFGLMYHSGIEYYYRRRAEGASHNDALDFVVDYALKATWEDGKPWVTDDNNRNRYTLLRSLVWYLDEFGQSTNTVVLDNGKPAVELSFRFQVGDMDGEPIFLSGHMDQVISFNDQIWVQDHKTTTSALGSYYFDNYTPDNQMSLYSLASKVVFHQPARGVMIDAAQIAVSFTRFSRGFAPRHEEVLTEWLADTIRWIRQAHWFAIEREWPMNDSSCSKFGGCAFRGICSKPPSIRAEFLAANFNQVLWDPTVPR